MQTKHSQFCYCPTFLTAKGKDSHQLQFKANLRLNASWTGCSLHILNAAHPQVLGLHYFLFHRDNLDGQVGCLSLLLSVKGMTQPAYDVSVFCISGKQPSPGGLSTHFQTPHILTPWMFFSDFLSMKMWMADKTGSCKTTAPNRK